MVYGLVIITPWWQNSGIDSPHLGRPFLADFRLTQSNMTALEYGRRLGRDEHWTPTLTENRSSQVHGD